MRGLEIMETIETTEEEREYFSAREELINEATREVEDKVWELLMNGVEED